VTQPLLGQRSRVELIAELYDRHAAGLFAYSHDQLGDADSASDVLVAVLSGVSETEPPRAALYALARREIFLRDIVYSPPVAGLDPAAALVDRVLSDLRTHQREVLYLSGVCEMDASELSWVLDVAVDTADELTVSACRRFAQSLGCALASAKVPEHMTEVFGALAVAPIRDVLNLAPWASPPARLRAAVLGPKAPPAASPGRPASPLFRQLWPTTPAWPLPLAPADPPIGASAFPAPDHTAEDRFPDPFAQREPDALSPHEATTEPMPRLGDSVLTALDTAALRPRRRLQRPRPRRAALPAPVTGDVLDDPPVRGDLFRPLTPEARAARVHTDKLVAAAPRTETSPAETSAAPSAETLRAPFVESPRSPAAQAPRTPLTGFPSREDRGDVLRDGPGDVPGGRLGDVLDDAPSLPGWPLQTDQLDALADRERHRSPSSSSPAREGDSPSAREAGPSPARETDPVRPSAIDWFADAAPSGTTTATPFDAATATPSGAQVPEAPTALPSWTPRTDHLRTSAGRAQLRLPRWVMHEDQSDDAPRPATPPNHALTPHEAPRADLGRDDAATTMPGNGFAAIPPMPPTGAKTGADEVVPSLSDRAASLERRSRREPRSHKATKNAAHHDWAWEVIGFVIAVTIAMIVFFAVPMMTTP